MHAGLAVGVLSALLVAVFGALNKRYVGHGGALMVTGVELAAGTVWVNTPMMRELRAPFGGYKQSGVGRDGPTSSVEFFTELKATTIPIDPVTMARFGA
jgi:hypothetical protein